MTPYEAYQKAFIAKTRLSELESIMVTNGSASYLYSLNIIKGRWEEGEPVIAMSAGYSYLYAKNVIKGKWKEAEPIILQNFTHAYAYAKDILKWRIKGNKDFYISVIPTLWNKFTKRVKSSPDIMTAYFKEAILK